MEPLLQPTTSRCHPCFRSSTRLVMYLSPLWPDSTLLNSTSNSEWGAIHPGRRALMGRDQGLSRTGSCSSTSWCGSLIRACTGHAIKQMSA